MLILVLEIQIKNSDIKFQKIEYLRQYKYEC